MNCFDPERCSIEEFAILCKWFRILYGRGLFSRPFLLSYFLNAEEMVYDKPSNSAR